MKNVRLELPRLSRTVSDVGAICRLAVARSLRFGAWARVDAWPQHGGPQTACWDADRLARALTLLLEDAAGVAGRDERVELRWRVHEEDVVIRIATPRPLARGDRLVAFFDGAHGEDEERELRADGLRAARDVVLAHGGTLARVRTRRGTTWVVALPRALDLATAREARARPSLGEVSAT
jgi:K+-sensing histidine kinase KdpD